MHALNRFHHHYPFALTALCVALIWYLCLFRPPHISMLDGISGFDKVVHSCMYLGTCSVFWLESKLCQRPKRTALKLLLGVVAPIVMSGIIELAQAYLTTYRSGEWADLAANSAGVVIAWGISPLIKRIIKISIDEETL